jgi:hypothetical protein
MPLEVFGNEHWLAKMDSQGRSPKIIATFGVLAINGDWAPPGIW